MGSRPGVRPAGLHEKGDQHGRQGRQERQDQESAAARDEAEKQGPKEAGQGAVQAIGRKHARRDQRIRMSDQPQRSVSTVNRIISTLRELVSPLDRREPQVDRPGELGIARESRMLRREAVAQIEALSRDEADETTMGKAATRGWPSPPQFPASVRARLRRRRGSSVVVGPLLQRSNGFNRTDLDADRDLPGPRNVSAHREFDSGHGSGGRWLALSRSARFVDRRHVPL